MANLKPLFSYADLLIGEEIIWRALDQQQSNAEDGKMGASWNSDLRVELGRVFFVSGIQRKQFDMTGFEHCEVRPPCPWPKPNDNMKDSDFMPILMSKDGVFSYKIKVSKLGNNNGAGDLLFSYNVNNDELASEVREQYTYFEKSGTAGNYKDNAILEIEQFNNGNLVNTFHYFFTFADPN